MMLTCVDLRERFGTRYRARKEADGATWYDTPEAERVWLLELPCRYGFVYPHGAEMLAAVVTGRYARQQVAALPCIVSRRGDEELVVTFRVDDAETVLAILKPRRRRQVSPEQREQLRAMGFGGRLRHAESAPAEPEATQGAKTGNIFSTEPTDAGNRPEAYLVVHGDEEAPA